MKTLYITKSDNVVNSPSFYSQKIKEKNFSIEENQELFINIANQFYQQTFNKKPSKDYIDFAYDAFRFYLDKKNNAKLLFSNLELQETYKVIKFTVPHNNLFVDAIKKLLAIEKIEYQLFLIQSSEEDENKMICYILLDHDYNIENTEDRKDLENKVTSLVEIFRATANIIPIAWNHIDKASNNFGDSNEISLFLKFVIESNLFKFFSVYLLENNNIISHDGYENICNGQKIIAIAKSLQGDSFLTGQINNPLLTTIFNKPISYIAVKDKDTTRIFLGIYDGIDDYKILSLIPILKNKFHYLTHSNLNLSTYQIKQMQSLLQGIPNELLLQIDNEDLSILLHEVSQVLSENTKVKFIVYKDRLEEFIHIVVLVASKKAEVYIYNSIYTLLANTLKAELVSNHYYGKNFTYLHFAVGAADISSDDINWQELENTICDIANLWQNKLLAALQDIYNKDAAKIFNQYSKAFNVDYQKQFGVAQAAIDIAKAKEAIENNKLVFNLEMINQKSYVLKVYTHKIFLLSDILPILENLGFKVCYEDRIKLNGPVAIYLHNFSILPINSSTLYSETLKHNIEEALEKTMMGNFASDALSKLIILSTLNVRQIITLRALTSYMHQISVTYGKIYAYEVLIKHHNYSKMLLEVFEYKFNPALKDADKVVSIENQLEEYLTKVSNSSEDNILRSLLLIIKAILRTNAFQMSKEASYKDYISFKFNSSKIPHLPKPIPYAEIYVYANEFEGVHLRAGKIARGGLRWSDRAEDYRTEALGLMKAQVTKNSVIVPTGSKGAFFIKIDKSSMSKEEYFDNVVVCYKNFLRGLLDLTDNIISGKVHHPANLVILDDHDPYLVVAADKGTASFSDYANEISAEYNFWLGDAFASGGKTGYDHKKLGITARGAWISVQRHFSDINIDANTHPLTVVGIGDMSGDVFGNGLLSSKYLKLVAAFNHIHIFLDPTPIPEVSFEERKRLFNLAGSNWSDYNSELISKGGGVFERKAKIIHLSPEIKDLLNLAQDEITPDELIASILKAKVDLIWNGGIGTYIKSRLETNLEIADKTNDNLRCNGQEIRATVIAEGGNIGVSQMGRIEYSKNNGKLNTDFIDNSAGVDCSDHEVNIKIILNEAVKQKYITIDERNDFLSNMTKEVQHLVLQDNFKQTRNITIMEKAFGHNIDIFARLIKHIEDQGLLNRQVEFLPSEKQLEDRIQSKEPLARPELSVILSYSKILCKNQLSASKILDQQYFIKYLHEYFPESMREKFVDFINKAALRKEILNNFLTNKVINVLTGPVLYNIILANDQSFDNVIASYFIVSELFEIDKLWNKIEMLDDDSQISSDVKIELLANIIKLLRRGISWLLKNHDNSFDVNESIGIYKEGLDKLLPKLPKLFVGTAKEKYLAKMDFYKTNGVSESLALEISRLEFAISAFDIVSVANNVNSQLDELAALYFKIGSDLEIDWLRKVTESDYTLNSYWGMLSAQAVKDDLYQKQRKLLEIVAIKFTDCNLHSWQKLNIYNYSKFKNFITDLKMQKIIDLSMIIVANKRMEALL